MRKIKATSDHETNKVIRDLTQKGWIVTMNKTLSFTHPNIGTFNLPISPATNVKIAVLAQQKIKRLLKGSPSR